MNPPRLPKRLSTTTRHNTYNLRDFIGQSDEFIKTANTSCILVDYNTLIGNIDLLRKIISILRISQINCSDYESALFLEQNLDESAELSLVDDYENKDRSYIDTTIFTKHKFYIPLSYIMWGVKFENSCNVHCLRSSARDNMTSLNGDTVLYRETIERLRKIIESINAANLTSLDKCILISNYLQSRVQYVEDGLKSYADKVYLIEAEEQEVTREKVGSITSVINENYGLCMAISNTTTLLLNNPIMNVNVRSLYGDSHVWNVIIIDGKYYYIDNTWAITRNKHRVEEALKATSFSDEFLLIGAITSSNIGHHNSTCYSSGELEQDDFSRDEIQEHIRSLSKKHKFTNYPSTLRFKSRIES